MPEMMRRSFDVLAPKRRGRVSKVGLIATLVAISGCGSGAASRAVAQLMLAETVTYEQQVDARMEAERRFYREGTEVLEQGRQRRQVVADRVLETQAVLELDAALGKADAPLTREELASWATNLDGRLQRIRSESQRLLAGGIEALELRRDDLAKVRKALVRLQAEPSQWERLQELVEFGQETKKQLDELSKRDGD